MKKLAGQAFDFLTGEVILKFMPNGGKAIIVRTIWVSFLIYALAIGIKSYMGETAVFEFSFAKLKKEISETVPWLGAILGATYAGLYTKFSSQWSYLADLYNQQISLALTNPEIVDEKNPHENENYKRWQAAFVEDAVIMHLATKEGFSSAINEMLKDKRLNAILKEELGENKFNNLEKSIRKIFPEF